MKKETIIADLKEAIENEFPEVYIEILSPDYNEFNIYEILIEDFRFPDIMDWKTKFSFTDYLNRTKMDITLFVNQLSKSEKIDIDFKVCEWFPEWYRNTLAQYYDRIPVLTCT